MPTVRGWALIGAGLALILLWVLLGDAELLMTGLFLTLTGIAAAIWIRWVGLRLSAGRTLSPVAVHEGETTSASVSVRNEGSRAIPQLTVVDEVRGLGSAAFEIAGLKAGQSAIGTYRVSCRPRGAYPVGPAIATATDPLGLAEMTGATGMVDRLVVYPAIEELHGVPATTGHGTVTATSLPDRSQRGGEDFYTLRPYQRGDDLRRVHWPWSAKADELMIRQFETPRQSQALVFLDTRSSSYGSVDAFEKAVSGAASAFAHFTKSGFVVDLWGGSQAPRGEQTYPAAMERMAVIQPEPPFDLGVASRHMRGVEAEGAAVVVTGTPDRQALALMRRLGSGRNTSVLMAVSRTTPQLLPEFHRDGTSTVLVGPEGSWADGWSKAVQRSWNELSAT